MSSRPILNVNGKRLDRLKMALALSDDNSGEEPDYNFNKPHHVFGYSESVGRLVFFRYHSDGVIPFPTKISLDRAAEIAFDWLSQQKYGSEPDHDGDNERGWRVFRDDWGRIDGCGHGSFVAVEPHWIEYGK